MYSLSTSVYVILIQRSGMKRAATEGYICKLPQVGRKLIGSTHSTPGAFRLYQHENYPPQPSAYEPPQLTSHARTIPPVPYGGDSYSGPMQGDLISG